MTLPMTGFGNGVRCEHLGVLRAFRLFSLVARIYLQRSDEAGGGLGQLKA